MNCCTSGSCSGTSAFFSRWSSKYAKRFRKKGLEKAQRLLLDGITQEPVHQKEILDIGCGVGSIHMTLLKEGAARATGVDLAEGMLEKARELSSQLGLNEKITYRLGDFVDLADSIPEVDITILDKVVCCYENLDRLLGESMRKTRRIYGVTHPRNNVLVGGIFGLQIAVSKLFRMKFRPFWHDWEAMNRKIAGNGFRLLYQKSTLAWDVAVFQRI